ncbi:GNAT family N-acetyltransferase [Erythrobacter sp. SDW2]|uniref:GNAT family N-acetyltransferase n=1 Tax=Erythrobacter sp. SDW2 TaxID=2907154 RepID=UPI001F232AE7|nr:GNAT family N-acetyltransferase [Erythrobacter sp. SDW2]UIP06000.1 GNAT family N-acetyltransferase [Erythrobacter sp. SDW2]
MRVDPASLEDPAVRQMVEYHQRDAQSLSPPGTSFALDVSGLAGPSITLLGAWENETLIAIGALKRLSGTHAELKSMRTHPDHLGKGAAKAILNALTEIARSEGMLRLSLETGTGEAFAPAKALYSGFGFAPGEAFSDYVNGAHNQCWHMAL